MSDPRGFYHVTILLISLFYCENIFLFFFGWSLPGYAHGSNRMSFCIVNLPNTCCCIDFCPEICLVFIEFFNFLLLFVFYILSRKILMKYLNEEWCLKFCKLWIDKILKYILPFHVFMCFVLCPYDDSVSAKFIYV